MKRRDFLKSTAVLGGGALLGGLASCDQEKTIYKDGLVLSTWNHGIPANQKAAELIESGGSAIDAVEAGVAVVESDPEGQSVGIGGLPDREGKVTLDACIMDSKGNAGSVSFVQNFEHPISIARRVMDDTPHVMLSGKGAEQFAMENGFAKTNLLTAKSKQAWEKWKVESKYVPKANIENHDTIGLLAQDKKGDLAGACTTSGMAYKLHGRVGDSPIIGAGLFVDNEVGGATATGVGELVMKTLGSFLVVELMRQGASPQEACEEAVQRIIKKMDYKDLQVGYIAMDTSGNIGGYSIHPGFNYALFKDGKNEMHDATSFTK